MRECRLTDGTCQYYCNIRNIKKKIPDSESTVQNNVVIHKDIIMGMKDYRRGFG
jgi:hypothetical protein